MGIAGLVAALSVIGVTVIGFDSRYAHAGDIQKLSTQLEINRITAEVSVLEIRKGTLQDKVYEAKSRNLKSRADIEIQDRYVRELSDVEKQIDVKRREIDKARN